MLTAVHLAKVRGFDILMERQVVHRLQNQILQAKEGPKKEADPEEFPVFGTKRVVSYSEE